LGRPRGNLLALALTRVVIVLSGVVANVTLLELLPRDTFGAYRLIWATVVLATFAANLGLGHHVNAEVSRDPERAQKLVGLGLRTTLLLSAATSVALVGWFVLTRPGEPEMWMAGGLAALTLAANATSQIVQGAIHGLRRMFLETSAILASRVVFVGSQVALAWAGFGLVELYAGRFVAAVVLWTALLWQFSRHVGRPEIDAEPGETRALLTAGRAFGATVLFSAISAQADTVMLGLLTSDTEVARYNAPAVVLLQLAFIANIFSRGFFPRIARLTGRADEAGREIVLLLRVLLVVSVPIAVGGVLVAEPLVLLVREGAYADAALPFVLLVLAVPLRFVSNGFGFSLTALDRQPVRARLDMVGAVLNVSLNLVAIPLYGAVGAAATTLVTDLVILLLVGRALREVAVIRGVSGTLVRVCGAASVMGVVVVLVPGHVFARVAAGAAVYGVASWAVGAWSRDDLRRLRRV
jgi:O-antigen/teichoic acid export membrane protein